MVLSIVVDGNTLTHRVRLNDGTNNGIDGLTSAADGSGSMGGIIIDDPNHDLVLQGWQTVTVEESDCTTAPRLFTGFIGDRTTTHGNYPTDGGRQVNVTLWDQNSLLSWALITGSDGKRPEESRTARIDWLLASDYLSTIVFDTGFVVPSGSSDFQEADYRDQYPRDVLDDVLGAFQVAFAFWDEAADKIGLFYDAMTATTRDSTLTISNDPADWTFADGVISGTCWPPYVDAELAQDPSEVYSLEDLTYTNGKLLQEDPTTKAQFFPSPYPDRGQATDRSRIGKPTTAQDYMNALLAQASAEQETVTCTLSCRRPTSGSWTPARGSASSSSTSTATRTSSIPGSRHGRRGRPSAGRTCTKCSSPSTSVGPSVAVAVAVAAIRHHRASRRRRPIAHASARAATSPSGPP
jgi:hypothetical protein